MKEELDLATDTTKVFKLIGPALVNQDLSEAKSNVGKRIEYIRQALCQVEECLFYVSISSGEMKRKDDQLASLDKKQDEAREKMQEIQIQMQKLQAAPN